jgi:hypothetical protein
MKTLLSCAYLPPVSCFAAIVRSAGVVLDAHSFYEKQSFRNRAEICGANGRLNLIVPVGHTQLYRTPVGDVRMAEGSAWNILHWRSIESAYRNSPYFDFYEDRLRPLFLHPRDTLFAQDQVLLEACLSLLGCDIPVTATTTYLDELPEDLLDLRQAFHPKKKRAVKYPEYPQVFRERTGFLEDLSILDLLCNVGPKSVEYLQSLPCECT